MGLKRTAPDAVCTGGAQDECVHALARSEPQACTRSVRRGCGPVPAMRVGPAASSRAVIPAHSLPGMRGVGRVRFPRSGVADRGVLCRQHRLILRGGGGLRRGDRLSGGRSGGVLRGVKAFGRRGVRVCPGAGGGPCRGWARCRRGYRRPRRSISVRQSLIERAMFSSVRSSASSSAAVRSAARSPLRWAGSSSSSSSVAEMSIW